MANRRYTQFMYSLHKMPVALDVDITLAGGGAVSGFAGLGIAAVVKQPAAGTFRIQLQDNYTQFFGMTWNSHSPATGAAVAGGAFVVGTTYKILTLGTTTAAQWAAAGVPVGVTPAVGVVFNAATAGAGTGTVQVMISAGIATCEVLGNPDLTLSPINVSGPNLGGFIFVGTYNSAGALANPTTGAVLGFSFLLSNSSSTVNGIS